ncbi:LuxR family transcriptional regulator [Nocardioides humi]|nr:LuxR family transcriptional regulator [Nocardioides humi]
MYLAPVGPTVTEPLLGRDDALAVLMEAAGAAADGRARVVTVLGGPGMGKTAVLDVFVARLPATTRVLRAAGHPNESDLPFAGLHQLLWGRHEVARRMPRLGAALGLTGGPGGAGLDTGIGHEFLSVIGTLAEEGPLALVVDDAHWLDRSTWQALVFAARRIDADAVVLVLAGDPAGPSVGSGDTIELGPLEPAQARAVAAALHPRLTHADLDWVCGEADGVPLLLRQIPAGLAAGPLEPDGWRPPPQRAPVVDRVDRHFRAVVGGLGEAERRAVLVVALQDLPGPALRAALARLGGGLADLDRAERLGLVRVVAGEARPTSTTAGYWVRQHATDGELRAAHAAIAHVLPEGSRRRVVHLDRALLDPDPAVGRALCAAATEAADRHDLAEAAALWHAAIRHGDPAERQAARAAAAEAHLGSGAGSAALALFRELVREAGDDRERAGWLERCVVTAFWLEPLSATVQAEESAARTLVARLLAGGARDREAGLRLLMAQVTARMVRGEYRIAASLAAPVAGLGLADDRIEAVLHALLTGVVAGDPPPPRVATAAVERLLPALATAAASDVTAIFGFLRHLGWWGDVGLSERVVATFEAAPLPRAMGDRLAVEPHRVAIELARGEWDAACLRLAEMERTALDSDFVVPYRFCAAHHALVLARRGDIAGSRTRWERIGAGGGMTPFFEHLDACARGLEELAHRNHDAALAALRRAHALATACGGVVPGQTSATADLIEALWRTGAEAEAVERATSYARFAERSGHPLEGALAARSLALVGAFATADDLDAAFDDAVERCRAAGSPYETARTQLAHGQRLRRDLRKAAATRALSEARDAFARLGAPAWVGIADAELAACGHRRYRGAPGTGEADAPLGRLTPREYAVVVEAAEGRSNPEIAERLYISRRTVEFHLSNAFRKLGVADRTDLAALLPREV